MAGEFMRESTEASAGPGGADGLVPAPIAVGERTVAAFVGRTERGPVNEATVLRSFDEYRRLFGAHVKFSFVSHAVQHFFAHGGREAVVVRLVNRASRAGFALPAGDDFLRLQTRHAGGHEFIRVSIDYDGAGARTDRFNLVVQRVSGHGSQRILDQELHNLVSMRPSDPLHVVDRLRYSKLVRLSGALPHQRPDATLAPAPGEPIPYIYPETEGTDGVDLTDYDVIGSNVEQSGLFALEAVEKIHFLCMPPAPKVELGITALLAADRYCERRRALMIWDPPWSWDSPGAAVAAIRAGSPVSQNALTYFPRIRPPRDLFWYPHGLPACGAIAGAFAKKAGRGDWTPPVDESGVTEAAPAAPAEPSQADSALLKRSGINVLRRSLGGNYLLSGNVTMAGSGAVAEARRLDRRRLSLFVMDAIARGTRWVPEALGDESTPRLLAEQVGRFLAMLHAQGALPGQAVEDAVRLDVERRQAGLVLKLGIAYCEPGEFSSFELEFGPGGPEIRPAGAQTAGQLAG